MGGKYARELRRIWRGYRRENPDATEGEFRSFLERMKSELGDRYITYQAIGLALEKLAPIDRVDEDEKIRFFWKKADEWNPQVRRCLKHWQKAMSE